MSKHKILVSGDVQGKFDAVFKSAGAVHKSHGPFTALFCVGNFFGKDDSQLTPYLKGEKTVPLPTYFVCGDHNDATRLPELVQGGGELCTNLTFLGCSGVTSVGDMKVAFVSGVTDADGSHQREADAAQSEKFSGLIKKCDIERLHQYDEKDVDVLLSAEWPYGFHHLFDPSLPPRGAPEGYEHVGSAVIGSLITKLCPRYHFAGLQDCYFQLSPYKNTPADVTHATRFIGLGTVQGARKQRSLYATNVQPLSAMEPAARLAITPPAGVTECPFAAKPRVRKDRDAEEPLRRVKKPKFVENAETGGYNRFSKQTSRTPPEGYVCKICNESGHYIQDCPEKQPQGRGSGPPEGYVCRICGKPGHYIDQCPQRQSNTDNCWFCLANPKVEAHMVVAIGDEAYMAIPKGGLNDLHALILPIEHVRSFASLPLSAAREVQRFKDALHKSYRDKGLECIFMERNLPTRSGFDQHMFVQCVALPPSRAKNAHETFMAAAQRASVPMQEMASAESLTELAKDSPYLYVELSDGKRLVYVAQGRVNVPLNFLRRVAAELLGQPEKADWKTCAQDKAAETKIVDKLKKIFKPNDFTV